jgi:hypothetical protein
MHTPISILFLLSLFVISPRVSSFLNGLTTSPASAGIEARFSMLTQTVQTLQQTALADRQQLNMLQQTVLTLQNTVHMKDAQLSAMDIKIQALTSVGKYYSNNTMLESLLIGFVVLSTFCTFRQMSQIVQSQLKINFRIKHTLIMDIIKTTFPVFVQVARYCHMVHIQRL